LFGLGTPLVDVEWLLEVLFSPPRTWPMGLTEDEIEILKIATAVAQYVSFGARGAQATPGSDENTLLAMKKLAALFRKNIAVPMYREYDKGVQRAGARIAPLCPDLYDESCTVEDAKGIFQGDMQRGWRASTLRVRPETQKVLPLFWDWLS